MIWSPSRLVFFSGVVDGLKLSKNEVVTVLGPDEKGWTEVRRKDGEEGLVPTTCIKGDCKKCIYGLFDLDSENWQTQPNLWKHQEFVWYKYSNLFYISEEENNFLDLLYYFRIKEIFRQIWRTSDKLTLVQLTLSLYKDHQSINIFQQNYQNWNSKSWRLYGATITLFKVL